MVNPMDIADTLSKTELVRKMYQTQKAGSEMEQRQAQSVLKEKTTGDAEKTKEAEKSDLLVISKDKPKDEDKKKYKKSEKEPDEKDQEGAEDNPPEHLDLTV
jgi:hypothetical protein